MRYYVIAGEASGDLHGANLLKALKQEDNAAEFRCWGGDLMQAEGGKIVKHYKQLAFMGFVEVILNLRTILKNISFCKKDILAYKPDALILIDYPGFNLRIAKWAKTQGIRVYYYISPTVWAWKENRVQTVKDSVEKMFVILPFEKKFYAERGVEVDYFGHPLADALAKEREKIPSREAFLKKHNLPERPIIAMLPGSRAQELKYILPRMLEAVKHFPSYQFVIGGSNALSKEAYKKAVKGHEVCVVMNDTYSLLYHAHAGIIKSGTSTLEAALFKLPQVVCYVGNALSIFIARRVSNVKYISLVNLILDKPAVTELIQSDLTEEKLVEELKNIIGGKKRYEILHEYNILESLLQDENISAKIAHKIFSLLKNTRATPA